MDIDRTRIGQYGTTRIELVSTENTISNNLQTSKSKPVNEPLFTIPKKRNSILSVIVFVLFICICLMVGIIVVYFSTPRPSRCMCKII